MRCMYHDESMADFERRYRPRSDGSPGREVACEICGGVWAIGIGGKPQECRRVLIPPPTKDQEEYLRRIHEQTGKYDPTVRVGGPNKRLTTER